MCIGMHRVSILWDGTEINRDTMHGRPRTRRHKKDPSCAKGTGSTQKPLGMMRAFAKSALMVSRALFSNADVSQKRKRAAALALRTEQASINMMEGHARKREAKLAMLLPLENGEEAQGHGKAAQQNRREVSCKARHYAPGHQPRVISQLPFSCWTAILASCTTRNCNDVRVSMLALCLSLATYSASLCVHLRMTHRSA